jgi:hypothetical protein
MKFTSRKAVGKDNVNGTGCKPKLTCAKNERPEVVMHRYKTSTSSVEELAGIRLWK